MEQGARAGLREDTAYTFTNAHSKTSGVEMTRREAEAGDRRRRTGVTGCLGFKWRPSSLGNERERGGGGKRGERGDSLSSFCAGHSGARLVRRDFANLALRPHLADEEAETLQR